MRPLRPRSRVLPKPVCTEWIPQAERTLCATPRLPWLRRPLLPAWRSLPRARPTRSVSGVMRLRAPSGPGRRTCWRRRGLPLWGVLRVRALVLLRARAAVLWARPGMLLAQSAGVGRICLAGSKSTDLLLRPAICIRCALSACHFCNAETGCAAQAPPTREAALPGGQPPFMLSLV
jgi:hypothetical protein